MVSLEASEMSEADPLSSISLKQLAALYASDAMTEETFKQLAVKFFSSAALHSTPGKYVSRSSSDAEKLMKSVTGCRAVSPRILTGNSTSFSAGAASPQLRQLPMTDRERYLFSIDLQNLYVLLRVPNLRESDAIRSLACLDPLSVHRCIEQLRRCRNKGPDNLLMAAAASPSVSTSAKYSSPVWKRAASAALTPRSVPAERSGTQPHASHVVSSRGVEEAAIWGGGSGQKKKAGIDGSRQRPSSAPASRLCGSSSNGVAPKITLCTGRSYALTHRDQVARDVAGAISWLGEVAIDTTSPATPAQRKAHRDFRAAQAHPRAKVGKQDYVENSAKKLGLLSQQTNTTSVVIKALQHGRTKPVGSTARDAGLPANSCTSHKWIQSDARFNMHQRRRQLLQQLL